MATCDRQAIQGALSQKQSLQDVAVQSATISEILDKAICIGDLSHGGGFLQVLENPFQIHLQRQDTNSEKPVLCFPWVLALAFFNLMKNVKDHCGGKGDPIALTITACDTPTGVNVTVADDGPGLPPGLDDLNAIFELGYSAQRSPDKEHQGLGLYVVQRIIRAHGGAITAEHRSPRGAQFTITLPEGKRDDNLDHK